MATLTVRLPDDKHDRLNPHISPIDAMLAPDFLRQRALTTETIVILLVEGVCGR